MLRRGLQMLIRRIPDTSHSPPATSPNFGAATGGVPHRKSTKGNAALRTAYRLLGTVVVVYLLMLFRLWWTKQHPDSSVGSLFNRPEDDSGSKNNVAQSLEKSFAGKAASEEAYVKHVPARSDTGLFVTMGSYIIDGDAQSGSHASRRTNDLIFVIIGVGDFTKTPQKISDAIAKIPPRVPEALVCILTDKTSGKDYRIENAVFHSNGTAYQGKISPSRGALYFGERAVWITCPVPKQDISLQTRLLSNPSDYLLRVVIETVRSVQTFDSGPTTPTLALSTRYDRPLHNLTLCSSAIYGLTGSKWIIEWLEYHRAVGFDSMDLYIHEVGQLALEALNHYVQQNSAGFFVRLHDWTTMLDNGPVGFNTATGVGRGVEGDAWEHGQRLTRNDCYLRNRGRSKWVMFCDVDEIFASTTSGKNIYDGPIMQFCEKEFEKDADKIACSFSSVTTPPNAKTTDESLLVLERIDTSESSCQVPYNCGRFHYGREKYAIRTARGTLNPNNPFFYHAISQNYDISERHHVLLPRTIGVVRHYAGHFSHSRKGGLGPRKALHNPLQPFVIERMRERIYAKGTPLNKIYETPNQKESFLKLDRITDLWRFAKAGEMPEESAEESELSHTRIGLERFMTFEYFGGRLNNQLWTLDWVFRVAQALNRTVILGVALAREHYIGFPSGPDDASLWDINSLRSAPFRFRFGWEIVNEEEKALLFADKTTLPQECIWEFSEDNKHVMQWAWKTNCNHQRMHFSTSQGLVHSYKADTRSYGVDPLVYWRFMRLHPDVDAIFQRWWNDKGTGEITEAIGLHFRSWREANGDAAHALKVCSRLSKKLLTNAAKRFDSLNAKCEEPCSSTVPHIDVHEFWNVNGLDITCLEATEERIKKICGGTLEINDSKNINFFVATDHETKEADIVFESLNAKMMYSVNTDELVNRFVETGPGGMPIRRYAKAILPILLDVHGLLQVDRFFGSPASTLSQAVCLWRRALDRKEEVPGMCQLVWYSTFSDLCEELCF